MAQSILSNHYLGAGVKQPPDEAFELALCAKDDHLVLVSSQGYLVSLDVGQLPFTVVEAIRLEPYDYIMASFVSAPGSSLLVMTQTGKIVHRTTDDLDSSAPQKKKGASLYSQSRRAAGVRVVGAAAVSEQDMGFSLHSDGSLFVHKIEAILNAGAIAPAGSVLAFAASQA
jgi:DNA gyrase/topoisomerase IV subunit A